MPLVGIGTPPQPPTRRLVCPLPPVSGGRGTLAGEKGVGRVPIPTRGIHCGTLYMYVLCDFIVYRTPPNPPPPIRNPSQLTVHRAEGGHCYLPPSTPPLTCPPSPPCESVGQMLRANPVHLFCGPCL
jgi:hypothetical protein